MFCNLCKMFDTDQSGSYNTSGFVFSVTLKIESQLKITLRWNGLRNFPQLHKQ
jgi:hypothetical protein